MLTRDASVILGKEKGILKDEANYTKGASVLLGFLALSSVAMGALLFYNANIALIQFLTCLVIFMILWARMNQKYGKK
jgi:membrane protein implicated in regulation of membrane protease activity